MRPMIGVSSCMREDLAVEKSMRERSREIKFLEK